MQKLLTLSLIFMPMVAKAWVMDESSTLTYVPVQSGVEIPSEFKNFDVSATVPTNTALAKFEVDVDILSAVADYGQVTEYVQLPVWFDGKNFPKAKFVSTFLEYVSDSKYIIKGDLTLKGVTAPVEGEMLVKEKSPSLFEADFTFNIDRLAFGVGTGEWGEGSIVDKNVLVKSSLKLKR